MFSFSNEDVAFGEEGALVTTSVTLTFTHKGK